MGQSAARERGGLRPPSSSMDQSTARERGGLRPLEKLALLPLPGAAAVEAPPIVGAQLQHRPPDAASPVATLWEAQVRPLGRGPIRRLFYLPSLHMLPVRVVLGGAG